MNRIYKVIWSKVRNCYVAVSEIAKRNGKGGGRDGCFRCYPWLGTVEKGRYLV